MISCRWSRIARKLPGRTDNEIKNYWRTYMRKKAQEKKRAMSSSSSSSSSSSISSSSNCSASSNPTTGLTPSTGTGAEGFCDIEGKAPASTEQKNFKIDNKSDADYSMDDIWTEIALKEGECITSGHDVYSREGCSFPCPPVVSSSWEYGVSDMLWHMDEEGEKVFLPIDSQVNCCYHLRG
ncbi:hypothetical protein SAY86_013962 [Trapa natans]|uniref:Uncharacterized protein n=1 Tax=Trapa natans TaxID=22666 RepID=A0AAN7QMC9_TRANT|nr:hypothetical protein SAY86_013962 [Trapa natans]